MANEPQMPALPPGDVLGAWLALSDELLALTDATGRIVWANAAFRTATGAADGDALPDGIDAGSPPDAELWLRPPGRPAVCISVRTRRIGEQTLWVLRDRTIEQTLAERLEVAQEFGRLGVWQRRIPSGEGSWDRHVFGFWGLDPAQGTPDFHSAMASIHPEDRRTQPYLDSVKQAGRYAQRFRVLRPDGTIRHLHSQWEVKADAQGRPERAVGVMVDDTQAYELARSLDATTTLLGLTVDLAHIVQWRHDLKTGLIHYNPNGFKVLQIAPHPHGMPIDEVRAMTHPDDLPLVLDSAQRAMLSNRPDDIEARYRRSDGTWRVMLTRRIVQRAADGTAIGFVGVSLDVTERRHAEDALRKADERAALAARSAGIGTWEVDLDDDGQVLAERWDEQMFHLRGLAPGEQPLGRESRLALVHPDDRATTIDARGEQTLAGDAPLSYEFRLLLPDGSVRWLASRSILVRDERRRSVRRVGVNWDITEAKSAETARQERALAERESRAKSQFLSRMSHELRTPLNAVLGFTELLQLDATRAQAAGQIAKLGHIRAAGQQLLAMVNDVLELTGLEAGQVPFDRQPLGVAALVDAALPQVAALALRHGVALQRGPLDAVVLGDAQRLGEVLVKLLSNAIRHSPPGGEVWVDAEAAGSATVALRVRDHGRGFSAQQLEQLFEPFSQPAAGDDGADTGIGLAIVKVLVDRMGGRMAVSSSPGRETVFALHLPAPAAAPAAPPGAAAQLLYIEDNPVNVLLVEELVSRHTALRIESAATGEEGVARARELQPALVLVDMHLPDFDGFEVLRRLRADPATRALRCVALSANAMAEDIACALAAGFVAYWTKPIDFGSFLGALAAQLDLSLAERSRAPG